jgi:NCS1 family nucleobase:cation symporter-1
MMGFMTLETETAKLPEDKREGSPRSLAATWAGVMFAPGAIITGMVAAGGENGPGFAFGFLGLTIGVLLGMIGLALISLWGPPTGLAAMPLGRLAFGGAILLPRIFLIFSLIAYNGLNDLFGVDALASSLGISFFFALACVFAIEVIVVFLGIRAMRILGLGISAVMVVIVIWLIFAIRDVAPAPLPTSSGDIPVAGIWLAIALGLSSSISWTVQATDLSRTLPVATSPRKLFLWVLLGSSLPLVVLGGIGAWLSTQAAIANPMNRVEAVLGGGFPAIVALVVMGVALATANGLNDFSAGLSLRQMGVRISRPLASMIVASVGLSIAIVARNSPLGDATQDIVLLAGYYTTPWFGIVMVELLIRRRNRENYVRPVKRMWPAAWSFLVAFLALLPFTATPIGNSIAESTPLLSWIGWVSRNVLGGADAGYIVGVVAGAGFYLLLRRIEPIRRGK